MQFHRSTMLVPMGLVPFQQSGLSSHIASLTPYLKWLPLLRPFCYKEFYLVFVTLLLALEWKAL